MKDIFSISPQKDYALLDSGEGMKLERYGDVLIARPDPQALWHKKLSEKEWRKVDAYFSAEKGAHEENEKGKWVITRPKLADSWKISFGDAVINIRLTPFKHTGLFPEQLNNWTWCRYIIKDEIASREKAQGEKSVSGKSDGKSARGNIAEKPKVLNLFGYTGGASVSAAIAGADVTHVDASRSSITWASENAKASGLDEKAIRWILDDALSFVKREVRRGSKYDAIMMDPPAFGRGAKGEIWKIEKGFLELFDDCLKLLSDKPLFFVLNGYSAGYSAIAYENNMKVLVEKYGGSLESGELSIQEEPSPEGTSRLLPCGIVSRWKKS